MKPTVDIVVIEKQTALERYTRRALNVDFLEYIEHGGGNLEDLKSAHADHVRCRSQLEQELKGLGLKFVRWNLDELTEQGLPFFHIHSPNLLQPRLKLVLTLGGDGTLLHGSHFVGGNIQLLGINSCPAHSVGALCGADEYSLSNKIGAVLNKHETPVMVRRLLVEISEGSTPPLALNDVLICNQHPAATSRYQLTVARGSHQQHETQLSSGLWMSTAAGSSAAVASYGLPRLPLSSSNALLAVREPYARGGRYLLNGLQVDLDKDSVTVFSKMRVGLVCTDGPDHCAMMGFGTQLRISSPTWASLQLISKASSDSAEQGAPL
jgi:NAD+ kinase